MQPKKIISNNNPPKKKKRGHYKIEKFDELYQCTGESLGAGACGKVKSYLSRDKKKEFAVKIVRKVNNLTRIRVLKEIEVLHHCLGHENIVQMQEFYEEDDCFYLVFEKMEGGSLLNYLESCRSLSEWEASRIVRDVARALKFLHNKNIAHRDVKLENILCSGEDFFPVKLCDFDLCVDPNRSPCCGDHNLEMFSSAVGSFDYMAPEVVKLWLDESVHYTKQCDMWSLGVLLYILLSGEKPFACRPGEICYCRENYQCEYCNEAHLESIKCGDYFMSGDWDFISDEAVDLVSKLLEKDPRRRYTAEQVLEHPWIKNPTPVHRASTPSTCSFLRKMRKLTYNSGTSSRWSNCYDSEDDANLTDGVFKISLDDFQNESPGEDYKFERIRERRQWRLDSSDSGNISGFSPVGSPDGA